MPEGKTTPRRAALALGGVALFVLLTGVALEATLRIAEWAGVFRSWPRLTEPGFYRDDDRRWGVWHPPDFRHRAQADCYDVVYESNSFGMRDPERTLRSAVPRVAVLGDSFVEGWGVAFGSRFSDRLEARTGVPHLNFGSAANFSSTQEWLLYEGLVTRFDHDRVLLFTLPKNDFLENDPDRWWQRDRYRPYLRERDGAWTLWYPVEFEAAQRAAARQLAWNRLYNALYVYRFVAWVEPRVRARLSEGATGPLGYIGYVDYSEADLERLLHGYRKLRDAAGGRPVVIFTVPALADLLYLEAHGELGDLAARLRDFAAAEQGIAYADLAEGFAARVRAAGREPADYFLPCDGHWNELGHEAASEVVLSELERLSLAP